MKAKLKDRVIAESDDIVVEGGYHYFPNRACAWSGLTKAPKTESDHACPHGVQFYDVMIDGERHERAAWTYEAPLPSMSHVADRIGFWKRSRWVEALAGLLTRRSFSSAASAVRRASSSATKASWNSLP